MLKKASASAAVAHSQIWSQLSAWLILGVSQAGAAAFAEGTGYGRRPNPERREAMQRQQAEAMAKLSSANKNRGPEPPGRSQPGSGQTKSGFI